MAVRFFLTFFVLSCLVFLQPVPAEEADNIKRRCPNSFDCNNLGRIAFPLSNSAANSQCGLYTLTCDEDHPKTHLGNKRSWYEVIGDIIQSRNITRVQIHDQKLQHLLQSKSCDTFEHYLRFPNSTSISFTIISRTLTLFKCNKIPPTDDHFNGFLKHTDCPDFNIYYKNPDNDQHAAPNCPTIQLPISRNHDPNDLFGLLAATFSVELNVSDNCWDCHLGGGQCPNDNQVFHCKTKKGKTNLGLILGIVIPSVTIIIFMICCLIFTSKRRKYFPSFLILRKTTSDPSREADLECSSIFFGISIFSYRELQEATNNFDPSKELGNGGFGTVYHGKLQDGREVAVKRLYEHNYKRVKQFMNEIEILTRLRHPNLVTLYGCTSRHSCELLLVYEYIPNGTVADHLHGDRAKDGSLSWPIRMNIAIETASALAYLHATDIIHRDVKTNNILLDNNFCIKVADFGLSRLFPNDVTHVSTAPQGTPGYVDPEYHECYQLTAKSDVYSFGVVLIELVSSLPAVDINRHRHEINLANVAINRIQNGAFNELIDTSLGFESDSSVERMTTSVAEVAFRCLQLDKEMRPTMDDVLEALKEIKDYKDETMGKRLPPSPEGDNTVLLKEYKTAISTDSVTSARVSSYSTSISSG